VLLLVRGEVSGNGFGEKGAENGRGGRGPMERLGTVSLFFFGQRGGGPERGRKNI
jgi:hypothetical protein